ncbi:MAG: hypothetical protein AB7O57_24060, partial [Hyphomicrobiaceae bacterium]
MLELTRALAIDPANATAASRLSQLLGEARLGERASLDVTGLAACLAHRIVDRDAVAAAAIDWLKRRGPLQQALLLADAHGWKVAAESVLSRQSSPLLRDELLLAVLEHSIVTDREVELLLTAIRRALLLATPRQRLLEPELARFAAALAAQLWSNEYGFLVAPDEAEALALPPPCMDQLLAGDPVAGAEQLCRVLYENP